MFEPEYTTLSIASIGPSTLPKDIPKKIALHKTNDISDIEGSSYQSKYERYTNKPPYNPEDIPGSQPKQLIKPRNGPNFSLYIDDIEGTRYTIRDKMLLSNRHCNPLMPEYKLPSYIPAIPYEPKFIRDNINFNDVEGSHPKPLYKHETRDLYNVNDIDGAKADYKYKYQRKRLDGQPNDIMKVDDIIKKTTRFVDRTSRISNNLDPIYYINGVYIEDDKKYSKPKAFKKLINDNFLLKTVDIPGATAGWKETVDLFRSSKRRDIRNINYIADIEGAQADTLKRSLVTNRHTNPLYPVYQSLDDGEPLLPLVKPLIPSNIITHPTWRPPRPNETKTTEMKKSFTSSDLNLNLSTKMVPFDWSANNNTSNLSSYRQESNRSNNSTSNNQLFKSTSGNISYRSNNSNRSNTSQRSKKSIELQVDIDVVRSLQ